MLRKVVCVAVAFAFFAGVVSAQEKKPQPKGKNVTGTIKKVDAASGKLTVEITVKKEKQEKEYTIGDTVKITVFAGKEKTELTGKAGLKNENFKEGTKVTLTVDAKDVVTAIRIGNPPKKEKQ